MHLQQRAVPVLRPSVLFEEGLDKLGVQPSVEVRLVRAHPSHRVQVLHRRAGLLPGCLPVSTQRAAGSVHHRLVPQSLALLEEARRCP